MGVLHISTVVPTKPGRGAVRGLFVGAAICLTPLLVLRGAPSLPCPAGDQHCEVQSANESTVLAVLAAIGLALMLAAIVMATIRRSLEFHVPPGWPPPPEGWQPPSGWQPPAEWSLAPPAWRYWRSSAATVRGGTTWLLLGVLAGAGAALFTHLGLTAIDMGELLFLCGVALALAGIVLVVVGLTLLACYAVQGPRSQRRAKR